MVKIRDIADRAGVSISTVSYALNGNSKVTEETRSRILAIAKEMKYTPNLAGRALKKQKTNIIGLYVSDFGGEFYSHVIDGVVSVLKKNDYELIVGTGGSRSRAFIPQKFVDGAIILDVAFPTELISDYADAGNRLVIMDREINHKNVCRVMLNNIEGSEKAINALESVGVKHYIVVTGPTDSYDSQVRLKTAITQVEKKSDQSILVIPSDFTIHGGKKAAETIFNMGLTDVGIFALNDELAVGLYEGFSEHEVEVGKDLHIIGFDNDLLGTYLRPGLTTIDYSKHQWGERAAETLIAMINGDETKKDQFIQTRVIHRGSLGENRVD